MLHHCARGVRRTIGRFHAASQSTVSFERRDDVALITMDDTKMNSFSFAMIDQLNIAFDQVGDAKAVVLAGNGKCFSAGFDLGVMMGGDKVGGPAQNALQRKAAAVWPSQAPPPPRTLLNQCCNLTPILDLASARSWTPFSQTQLVSTRACRP